MPADPPTLDQPRDERAVRKARNSRRLALSVLTVIVLAGLVGLLGIRSSTVTDSGSGYELSVTHADVTRAGIAVPFHVQVRRAGGFDVPIQLAFSSSLVERFDFQNYYPNPSAETADGRYVLYEFDPPPGDVFVVSLDARTAPDQNGSVDTYRVRLMTGSVTAAQVDFRMVVVP